MARTERLFEVRFVSDCETAIYRTGEIYGIPGEDIEGYLQRYGEKGCDELQDFACRIIQICANRKNRIIDIKSKSESQDKMI